MKNRICSIDSCGERTEARGWCLRHYNSWRKWGDPLRAPKGRPVREILSTDLGAIERLMSHVVVTPGPLDTDCWLSTYAKNSRGYTSLWVSGSRRRAAAHRLAYAALIGPIPDGLQLDHLCRVRHCCNPSHLEPVTAMMNRCRAAAVKYGPSPSNTFKSLDFPRT